MKILKDDIKKCEFKRCYLFYGVEEYIKELYKDRIKSSIMDKSSLPMNFTIFDGKKTEVSQIIDASETFPFLSEKRLVLVKDSGLFQSGRKNETEKMAEYIDKIPDSSCILFYETDVDKRGKLYKVVTKVGHSVDFKTPQDSELINWIATQFAKNDLKIDQKTAIHLLRTVAGSMESISGEIKKLVSYKNGDKISNISQEDIDNVCIKAFETKIFDLVGAIGEKNSDKAVKIYRNMIIMKESPIMILSMVIRQFRFILQSKFLANLGMNQGGISIRLGQRDFFIRECIKQGANFSESALREAITDCLETDINIKSGKMNDDLAVELLIIKYSINNK